MLDFFGAEDGAARTHQVHTEVELEAVLTRPELEDPKGVHVSEIISQRHFNLFILFTNFKFGFKLWGCS
jgi:hypothetical protein